MGCFPAYATLVQKFDSPATHPRTLDLVPSTSCCCPLPRALMTSRPHDITPSPEHLFARPPPAAADRTPVRSCQPPASLAKTFRQDLTSTPLSPTLIHMTATHFIRRTADRIGLDPWDVNLRECLSFARATEQEPVSRFPWGSPCRFVRTIDVIVHVLLPAALEERYPELATYLRSTSPRWGRSFRGWKNLAQ